MRIVVGLGNVGAKYEHSRHNIGFITLNHYAEIHQLHFEVKTKFEAEIAKSNNVIFVKPLTMMNRSGQAVRKVGDYFNVTTEDILIIYDELALPFGTIRTRYGGSAAGHNGVRSIIDHLSSPDFKRLRIGIANKYSDQTPAEQFVLQTLAKNEKSQLSDVLDLASPLIAEFARDGNMPIETVRTVDDHQDKILDPNRSSA